MMMMLPCWFVVLKLVAAAGGRIVLGCSCLVVLLLIFGIEFWQVMMMGGCDVVAGTWPGTPTLTWTGVV